MKLIVVKYEGKKPYRDRTPLRNEWEPGDIKRVPERDAKILLRFAEFERAEEAEATDRPEDAEATDRPEDAEATDRPEDVEATDRPEDVEATDRPEDVEAAIAAQTQRENDERNETEAMLMLVDTMDKDALEAYALKYEINLDKRRGLDKLRGEVVSLIEQFGAR